MFASAVLLISDLQTVFFNKAVVLIAFGFRLPLIIAIGLRTATFQGNSVLTSNFTLAEDSYIIWTVTLINYSLISATIPILRPFINSLSTNYGIGAATEYSGSQSQSHNGTYQLSTFRSNGRKGSRLYRSQRSRQSQSQEPAIPYGIGTDAVAYAGKPAGSTSASSSNMPRDPDVDSIASSDSQKMIIRKDVQWTIHRDEPVP